MDLFLAQAAESAGTSTTSEAVLFWVFATIGIGAGIAMITMKNIVHAAMMLVINFLAIAALYLAVQSSFLSIVQIIVYAGAIMVLFLFVIMLLGIHRDDLLFATGNGQKIGAAVAGVALVGLVLFAFVGDYTGSASLCGAQASAEATATAGADDVPCVGLDQALAENENGSVGVIADRMFTRYTFPFEAAALLLVVATIGALILGKKDDPTADELEGYLPTASTTPTADTGVVLGDDAETAQTTDTSTTEVV
jgi:NADH-quinone oxidoreductase subunit J